jgi:heme ABC exporter ATP-binding subunit CcmA
MASAIHLRDAVAVAGRFPLLAGVHLEIAEGEIVHLRGPNGAGKTSILRACAGLVTITDGEAHVLGYDLREERREVRKHVGLLGHATFLYDVLTVEDNVHFAVRAARSPVAAVDPALERLGLAGRLRKVPVHRLSAGQRRRTALAVLVARAPRLWLLDEPHAGLDDAGRDVLDAVVSEARAAGGTVVVASHEHDRAGRLADRVIWVAGGQAVAPPAPKIVEAVRHAV